MVRLMMVILALVRENPQIPSKLIHSMLEFKRNREKYVEIGIESF